MPTPYADIKQKVQDKFGSEAFSSFMRFLKNHPPTLWGTVQPRLFLTHVAVLVLYHDMFYIGYETIMADVDIRINMSKHSFIYNAGQIRQTGAAWADTVIQPGSAPSWNHAARYVALPAPLKAVQLWADSTDFRLQQHGRTSRKGELWSYKLKHAGWRYMFVRNGRGAVLQLWGGYSPKIKDGTFLVAAKREFTQLFSGAHVIADQEFSSAKSSFPSIKFYLAHRAPQKRKPKRGQRGPPPPPPVLPEVKKRWNDDIYAARARVEDTFGWMKSHFHCLQQPWREATEQLDSVVKIAAACYSFTVL